MDKFFNAFGFGLAVVLASSLAVHTRDPVEDTTLVPAQAAVVTDPIAIQGNTAVRQIEADARDAARGTRPVQLNELAAVGS